MTQNTTSPARPADDDVLTFALLDLAVSILLGTRYGMHSVRERAAAARDARELLLAGAAAARTAVAGAEDPATTASALAQGLRARLGALGAHGRVVAHGQLAMWDRIAGNVTPAEVCDDCGAEIGLDGVCTPDCAEVADWADWD